MTVEEQVQREIAEICEREDRDYDTAIHRYLNNMWQHFLPEDTSMPHVSSRHLSKRHNDRTNGEFLEGDFTKKYHSDIYLSQTPEEFYRSLDSVVDEIGFDAEELKQKIEESRAEGITEIYKTIFLPVCIEMIKRGYVTEDVKS